MNVLLFFFFFGGGVRFSGVFCLDALLPVCGYQTHSVLPLCFHFAQFDYQLFLLDYLSVQVKSPLCNVVFFLLLFILQNSVAQIQILSCFGVMKKAKTKETRILVKGGGVF